MTEYNDNQIIKVHTGCRLRSFTFFQRSNLNCRANPMF